MFRLHKNYFDGLEDDLVKAFLEDFDGFEAAFGDDWIRAEFFEQVRVPEIHRRSDLVAMFGKKRLVNIEFKLHDFKGVITQATDHLKWADYSYICMPMLSLHFGPSSFMENIINSKLGLIVGNQHTFFEVRRARHNTYKSGKEKHIREAVLGRINKIKANRSQLSLI